MPREDRERLATFVSDVYDLLRRTTFEHQDWLPGDDLWFAYENAVLELEAAVQDTIGTLLLEDTLRDPAPDFVDAFEAELARRGLTGRQLDLKYRGWRRALDRFRARPNRAFLRLAFNWANVLLGSLAGLIGAAEAIKEYKEAVEAGIADEEI